MVLIVSMKRRSIVSESCYTHGQFVVLPVICGGRTHRVEMDPDQALRLSADLVKAAIGIIGERHQAITENASNIYPLFRPEGAVNAKLCDR
jgi:hypothetical protein